MGFLFGTTSAAFQVEGAADSDGRSPSIWDVLAAAPGRVLDGSTGPGDAGLYTHWQTDLDLISRLGVGAHRFSISWSRVVPAHSTSPGRVNAAGLDFYDRLVDGLRDRGVAPWATLYHSDLPAALMDAGGWLLRDTSELFGEYVAAVAHRLADRVDAWITMADPLPHMALGHAAGVDAPGLTLLEDAFPVTHHLLLGHVRAREVLRAAGSHMVGIANSHTRVTPAGPSREDRRAAALYDAYHHAQFVDPLLLGRYPRLISGLLNRYESFIRDGDLAAIAGPLDFYGMNYQSPTTVAAGHGNRRVPFSLETPAGPLTDAGLPVRPSALTEMLIGFRRRYPGSPPLYLTEMGAAFGDLPGESDLARIDYLDGHLAAVRSAIAAGVDIRGMFFRSLTDGWEGTEGFTQQYGLVHVDPATGQRTPRRSFWHYRELIAESTAG